MNGQLENLDKSLNAAGSERNLYAGPTYDDKVDMSVETDFLAAKVDDPAGAIYDKILRGKSGFLSAKERRAWANFVIAQILRVPSSIQRLRSHGPTVLKRAIAQMMTDQGVEKIHISDADASTVHRTLKESSIFALEHAVLDSKSVKALLKSFWKTIDLTSSGVKLVVGDRPVIQYNAPRDKKRVMILPLSPTVVFVVAGTIKMLRAIEKHAAQCPQDFAHALNTDSVAKADTYVYASDRSNLAVIKKHLRTPGSKDTHHLGALRDVPFE